MAKRMMADVLWEAANKFLSPDYESYGEKTDPFSCNAVKLALQNRDMSWNDASEFISQCGCNGSAEALSYVCGFENGDKRLQGVRYMWLLLAMHVAEDEGLTV